MTKPAPDRISDESRLLQTAVLAIRVSGKCTSAYRPAEQALHGSRRAGPFVRHL